MSASRSPRKQSAAAELAWNAAFDQVRASVAATAGRCKHRVGALPSKPCGRWGGCEHGFNPAFCQGGGCLRLAFRARAGGKLRLVARRRDTLLPLQTIRKVRTQLRKKGLLPMAKNAQIAHSAYDAAPERADALALPARRSVVADDDVAVLPGARLMAPMSAQDAERHPGLTRLGVKRVIGESGLHLTDYEVSSLMQALDMDGSGRVPLPLLQAVVLTAPPPAKAGTGRKSLGGTTTMRKTGGSTRSPRQPFNAGGSLASPIRGGSDALDQARQLVQGQRHSLAATMLAQATGDTSPTPSRQRTGVPSAGRPPPQRPAGKPRAKEVFGPHTSAEPGATLVTTKQLAEAVASTHPEANQAGFHNMNPRQALAAIQTRLAATLASSGAVSDAHGSGPMDEEQVQCALAEMQQRVAARIGTFDAYAMAQNHLRTSGRLARATSPRGRRHAAMGKSHTDAASAGHPPVDASTLAGAAGTAPVVQLQHVAEVLGGGHTPQAGGRAGGSGVFKARQDAAPGAPGMITRTTALRQALGSRPASARGRLQAPSRPASKHGAERGLWVDFDGFVRLCRAQLGLRLTPAVSRQLFDLFDTNGTGLLNVLDVLQSAGLAVSPAPGASQKAPAQAPAASTTAPPQEVAEAIWEREEAKAAREAQPLLSGPSVSGIQVQGTQAEPEAQGAGGDDVYGPAHELVDDIQGTLQDHAEAMGATRGTALLTRLQEGSKPAGMSSRLLGGESAARAATRAPSSTADAAHRKALQERAPTVAALAAEGSLASVAATPGTPTRKWDTGFSSYAATTDIRAIERAEAAEAAQRAEAREEELRAAEELEGWMREREEAGPRVRASLAGQLGAGGGEAGASDSKHAAASQTPLWQPKPLAKTGRARDGVHLYDRIQSPIIGALPEGPAAMPQRNFRLPTPPEQGGAVTSVLERLFIGEDKRLSGRRDFKGHGRSGANAHNGISSSAMAGTARRGEARATGHLHNGGRPVAEQEPHFAYITVFDKVGRPVRRRVNLPPPGTTVGRGFPTDTAVPHPTPPPGMANTWSAASIASSARLSRTRLANGSGRGSARRQTRSARLPGAAGALSLQQEMRSLMG